MLTSHPALHSFMMESKEWAVIPGMMCEILSLSGSSGMARVHVCVEFTRAPSEFAVILVLVSVVLY